MTDTTVSTGVCKWFNNKQGFGFLTVLDGDKKGQDVFVHHTKLSVDGELYKYLTQGEYVWFTLANSESDKHEFQAENVRGVCDGELMCEVRNRIQREKENYEESSGSSNSRKTTNYTKNKKRDNTIRLNVNGAKPGEKWSLVKE